MGDEMKTRAVEQLIDINATLNTVSEDLDAMNYDKMTVLRMSFQADKIAEKASQVQARLAQLELRLGMAPEMRTKWSLLKGLYEGT